MDVSGRRSRLMQTKALFYWTPSSPPSSCVPQPFCRYPASLVVWWPPWDSRMALKRVQTGRVHPRHLLAAACGSCICSAL